jgi:hypothetical protein
MRYRDVDIWRCLSVTIPAEHLEALRQRALAADVEPISDPLELARQSIRAHQEDMGWVTRPDLPEIDIRMHGPGVPGHDIPVREAMSILAPFQETVSSLGQVITQQATASGPINASVLRFTELRMTPELLPGSVIFRLTGPGEDLSGDEAAALTGSDTLVDEAMRALFEIVDQSANTEDLGAAGNLAEGLRRYGPRVAKHLSHLVDSIVKDGIELDMSWRTPRGRRREATLPRRSAMTIQEAIKLNEVVSRRVELTGTLITISRTKKAELKLPDRGSLKLEVPAHLTPSLGPFYDKNVTVIVDETVRWSAHTGRETRTYAMRSIHLVDAADSGQPEISVGGETGRRKSRKTATA